MTKPERNRVEQAILYLARQSAEDVAFGAVKLAKLLFFSDFEAMRALGRPITALKYYKLPQGPVPTRAKAIEKEMTRAGKIVHEERRLGRTKQRRVIAKVEPDLSVFGTEELAVFQRVLNLLRDENATSVSDLSHSLIGWQAAHDNEEIPLITAIINTRQPTAKEREYAAKFAANSSR